MDMLTQISHTVATAGFPILLVSGSGVGGEEGTDVSVNFGTPTKFISYLLCSPRWSGWYGRRVSFFTKEAGSVLRPRGGGGRFKTPGAGQFGTPKVDSGNINLNIDYPRRMLSI